MKKIQKKQIIVVTLVLGILFAGVYMANSKAQKKVSVTIKNEEPALQTIGEKAEGENIYKLIMENATGKDIVGVSVKDSSMETFSNNMMNKGEVFAAGEKREFYYDATDAVAAVKETESEDQLVLKPQYDIQLTFEDETVFVLNAFPFEDSEECQICFEDEVAFIKYKSLTDGQHVSTKDTELAILSEKEKKKQEEAAAQAEAEAAAAAQAEAEAAAAARAEAEAAATQEKQQQQQVQPSNGADNSQGCVGDDAAFW